jgi:putative phosphoesterase
MGNYIHLKNRVAVISDIHGNLRALNAVLEEIEREQVDHIVVCGDVAAGPFPSETINRLMKLGELTSFVCGNSDREIVAAYDSQQPVNIKEEDHAFLIASWCANQIDSNQRDFLANFSDRVVMKISDFGKVLFCHGSPRSDMEMITMFTPETDLIRMLSGVEENVVACGHTHHQFDRNVEPYRVINVGSVGMPYEGIPAAFWALIGPDVELRMTEYDAKGTADEAVSADYPDPTYSETILEPPGPEEVARYFEQVAAERGERG